MIIKKSSVNGSSYDLYHENGKANENWVSQFNEELKPGNTYRHYDYGDVKVYSLNIHPSIGVKSFLYFWFKIYPKYEINVVFTYVDQGMPGVTSLPMDKFVTGLHSHLMFQNRLSQKVAQFK